MRVQLPDLLIELISSDPQVSNGWNQIFEREIITTAAKPESVYPQIRLTVDVLDHLLDPPAVQPFFEEAGGEQQREVRYYETEEGGFLDLARPAQISFNFEASTAEIKLTRQGIDAGNLEDLTLIALAPFLRRRGFFLVHAFAAARNSAVLLCGSPGSGKTTTGLAMLSNGWRYLANDAALLKEMDGEVRVYPSPGAINLHPKTFNLLPEYQRTVGPIQWTKNAGKSPFARGHLLSEGMFAESSIVTAIIFPAITGQAQYSLHEVDPAIGLARLIEDNVDQWDRSTYVEHIDLLTNLSRQISFYNLHLARDHALTVGFFDTLQQMIERRG
jgi:hypothetical protein